MTESNLSAVAQSGARAWIIYGLLEAWCVILVPWMLDPAHLYKQYHAGFTVSLFLLYASLGAVLAVTAGAWLPRVVRLLDSNVEEKKVIVATGTCSLVLFYALSRLFFLTPRWSIESGLLWSPILLLGAVLGCSREAWSRQFGFFLSPWVASTLLLGTPWVLSDRLAQDSATVRIGGALGLLLLTYLLWRSLRGQPERSSFSNQSPNRALVEPPLLRLCAAALIVSGLTLFLRQQPLTAPASLVPGPVGLPNVVLISLDTVRADHLSVYGYERDTTPYLKNVARQATLYTNAISSGDMTLTTHASMFTGMFGSSHGAHPSLNNSLGHPLDEKFDTLAEILSQHGYATAVVAANTGYLNPSWGFDQGFAHYDNRGTVRFLEFAPVYSLRFTAWKLLSQFASKRNQEPVVYRDAELINGAAFSVLDRIQQTERPFFLFVNYMDAHRPYLPPSPYDRLYPGSHEKFIGETYYRDEIVPRLILGKGNLSEAERDYLVSQYDGAIRYLDTQIDSLLSYLKANQIYQNSLLIVTSDHGEAFGERQLIEHPVSVYADQIHVPLIIKYPMQRQGAVIGEPVSSADIFPTALATLGFEVPPGLDGTSLLDRGRMNNRIVIAESFPFVKLVDLDPSRFRRIERAAMMQSHKLIVSTTGKREFYDLSTDPLETENRYDPTSPAVISLQKFLNQREELTDSTSNPTRPVDAQTLENLKSLGYIN